MSVAVSEISLRRRRIDRRDADRAAHRHTSCRRIGVPFAKGPGIERTRDAGLEATRRTLAGTAVRRRSCELAAARNARLAHPTDERTDAGLRASAEDLVDRSGRAGVEPGRTFRWRKCRRRGRFRRRLVPRTLDRPPASVTGSCRRRHGARRGHRNCGLGDRRRVLDPRHDIARREIARPGSPGRITVLELDRLEEQERAAPRNDRCSPEPEALAPPHGSSAPTTLAA